MSQKGLVLHFNKRSLEALRCLPDREARGKPLSEVDGWLQAFSNLVAAVSKVEC